MKKILYAIILIIAFGAWKSCGANRHKDTDKADTEPTRTATQQPTNFPTTEGAEDTNAETSVESATKASPNAQLEIPLTPSNLTGETIVHRGYTTHYNTQWLIPNWVAYEITPEEAQGNLKREGEFQSDPAVHGKTAQPADYKRSGYDRGHMAPAADMKFSYKSMHESFYLSNICPQNHELNTGLWSVLEKRIRHWAENGETLYVVCGPIVKDTNTRIGYNKVVVPNAFFKVLCKKVNNRTYTIGFIFPNEACQGNIYNYSMSVDAVEKRTGFDFFSLLPDEEENIAERSSDLRVWQ